MLSSIGAEYFSSSHFPWNPSWETSRECKHAGSTGLCSVRLRKEADFLFPNHCDFNRLFLWKTGEKGWSTGQVPSYWKIMCQMLISAPIQTFILFFPLSFLVQFCPSSDRSDSLVACIQWWVFLKIILGIDMIRLWTKKHPVIIQRYSIFVFQYEAENCFYL